MDTDEIKNIRKDITALIWSLEILNPSREVSLAKTQLQLGKSWLGKVLKMAQQENPYPESDNALSATIEPQADVPDGNIFYDNLTVGTHQSQTALVKKIRGLIQTVIRVVRTQYGSLLRDPSGFEAGDYIWAEKYIEQSILSLEEAKMWLGWELNRILQQILAEGAPQGHTQRINLPLQ